MNSVQCLVRNLVQQLPSAVVAAPVLAGVCWSTNALDEQLPLRVPDVQSRKPAAVLLPVSHRPLPGQVPDVQGVSFD